VRILPALPTVLLTAFFVFHGGPARAQAPTCPGADAEGAARALSEGDRASDRAAAAVRRHRVEDARRAWAEAFDAYERACAHGADEALERRAIPLFRLGRVVDAAVSLDAFLSLHPADTLEPEVARRVAANLSVIERSVATLHVTTQPSGAEIRVDGATRGVGPGLRVRVLAGSPVTLEVVAGGYETQTSTTTYEAGEHDVAASLRPLLVMSPDATSSSAATSPAPGQPMATQQPAAPLPRASRPHSPLPGLLIGGAVCAGLTLISAGLATALVLESEGVAGVVLLGDRDDAGLMSIGLYVGAGALLIPSVALLVAHANQGPPSERAWACGPFGVGVACAGRF